MFFFNFYLIGNLTLLELVTRGWKTPWNFALEKCSTPFAVKNYIFKITP